MDSHETKEGENISKIEENILPLLPTTTVNISPLLPSDNKKKNARSIWDKLNKRQNETKEGGNKSEIERNIPPPLPSDNKNKNTQSGWNSRRVEALRTHPKLFLMKLGLTLMCIGFLITNFSTEMINIAKLWNMLDNEKKENVKNVLQAGMARCFVNNITKTLSIVCNSNAIRSFSLGENFHFNNCSIP